MRAQADLRDTPVDPIMQDRKMAGRQDHTYSKSYGIRADQATGTTETCMRKSVQN